jgi:hypothetical protein
MIAAAGFAVMLGMSARNPRAMSAQIADSESSETQPADVPVEADEKANGLENGTKGKSEPATDRERCIARLDELEAAVVQQERNGKYGLPQVERYAIELEKEYLSNQENVRALSALDSPEASRDRQNLLSRQQHLSLLLWQLERVGGQLAQAANGRNGLGGIGNHQEISSLMSEYREVMKDVKLSRRFHDLLRRINELNHARLSSQLTDNFYFARPIPENSGSADENQDQPGEGAEAFEAGPLQSLKEPIGRLVRLVWKDGFLDWEKNHWETPFAGQTLESIDQQVRTSLLLRDVKLPEEDRLVGFRKKRLFQMPPAMLLFQDMQHVASQGKSVRRTSSSAGGTAQSQFTAGHVEAALKLSPMDSEFSVRERDAPNRTLQIRRRPEHELRISLIGDQILLLEQQSDGSVRWVDIGEEVTVVKAKSFAELYAKHADRIESRLFARLRHCGVHTPMTRYHPKLVSRVLDRMQGVSDDTTLRFEEIIAGIDGDSFGQRQRSYRELSEQIDRFSILIAGTSDEDDRSPEAAARLAELRKKYSDRFREMDVLISKTGWIDDPDHLLGMVPHVDDHQAAAISDRLESITGKSFGQDWGRWSKWLANRNDP